MVLGISNYVTFVLSGALAAVVLGIALWWLASSGHASHVHPRLRAAASSGWPPAACLALSATVILARYGTPISEIAVFAVYVGLGLAVPGMLWVRFFRGRSAHVAEDLALGLGAGYCLEIASYVAARAVGAPLLFLLWPVSTLVAFAAIPALRRHWRGTAARAPLWWSWSITVIIGYLLVYSAGTFFASHHLTGTDTPYIDMPYHLALIGELVNHVPPQIPYVSGTPLAYHWFYYAEAAATSWATGIEPVALLYRLSGLPMLAAFVVLTAATAQRMTGRYWSGPAAAAVALFGTVAEPYRWLTGSPVFDTQTLDLTWISPTNLFGLAIFGALVLAVIDLLQTEQRAPRRLWILVALLVFGASGAKASLLPLLMGGLAAVVVGTALFSRRLNRTAVAGFCLATVAFGLAAVILYRGAAPGLVLGLKSLGLLPVVDLAGAQGSSEVALAVVGFFVALVLWSFLWAGAFGLVSQRQRLSADPRVFLVVGIAVAALGAVTVMSYPGLSQIYYITAAAGAFGVIAIAGIAQLVPTRTDYRPLLAFGVFAAIAGGAATFVIAGLGPSSAPSLADGHLPGALLKILLPVLALMGVTVVAYLALRYAAPKRPVLQGATPLLMVALMMGFSLPNVVTVLESPFEVKPPSGFVVPGDGIGAARWLHDHSNPDDLVATDLHCTSYAVANAPCNPTSFWVSAYSERNVLVEGWAYTVKSVILPDGELAPFWDPALLAANDLTFTNPSAAAVAKLRDEYGVRWLLADMTRTDSEALGRYADLRYRDGQFAVYELR
jgi:hypothetical protein